MAGYIGSKASVVSSGAEHKKTFTITGATTSLTGLNYTVGKVHVFQNGVRLVDGTDYTATNGTTITLTTAAQSGDNVVVISQASYQVALSGIDDQSNATAITIDSSENVLIGNTDATPYDRTSGNAIAMGDGLISSAQSGGNAAIFNRMTSDGSIVGFRKGGVAVGSIGVNSGDLVIHSTTASHVGLIFGNTRIEPSSSTGSISDGTVDLGNTNPRFKDLYLSGGVYLGGTGSANKLDDYEEGNFTPSLGASSANPSVGYSTRSGYYIKVGGLVTVWIAITLSSMSGGSGNVLINGMPFTLRNDTAMLANQGGMIDQVTSDSRQISFQGDPGTTRFLLISGGGSTGSHGGMGSAEFQTSTDIRVCLQYSTTS